MKRTVGQYNKQQSDSSDNPELAPPSNWYVTTRTPTSKPSWRHVVDTRTIEFIMSPAKSIRHQTVPAEGVGLFSHPETHHGFKRPELELCSPRSNLKIGPRRFRGVRSAPRCALSPIATTNSAFPALLHTSDLQVGSRSPQP
eukprot:8579750-Alexandrium_andersonii.AAC.1